MSGPAVPFAVQPGEGTSLETPSGDTATVKVDTAATGGSLTIIEFTISPGLGPALHTHAREDELWCVLDGEFRFRAGDTMMQTSAGGMAFGPRGTPHAFQNIGDAPGRLLVITTPSGLEQFDALLPGPVDLEVLAAVARANGVEFVGPPLSVSDPLV